MLFQDVNHNHLVLVTVLRLSWVMQWLSHSLCLCCEVRSTSIIFITQNGQILHELCIWVTRVIGKVPWHGVFCYNIQLCDWSKTRAVVYFSTVWSRMCLTHAVKWCTEFNVVYSIFKWKKWIECFLMQGKAWLVQPSWRSCTLRWSLVEELVYGLQGQPVRRAAHSL